MAFTDSTVGITDSTVGITDSTVGKLDFKKVQESPTKSGFLTLFTASKFVLIDY